MRKKVSLIVTDVNVLSVMIKVRNSSTTVLDSVFLLCHFVLIFDLILTLSIMQIVFR